MHPAELYVWPKCVPLMHDESVYFLMAYRRGFNLILDTSHLGALKFDSKQKCFKAEIREVDDSSLKG